MTPKSWPVLTAACGAVILIACERSSTGPEPLDADAYFIADYTVSGDTIFMRMPADTTWDCWTGNPTMQIHDPETDTSLFEISGNQLVVFEAVDTARTYVNGEESWALAQRHSRFSRTGGGSGLESRWRWIGTGHDVLSESPDRKVRADMEHNDSLNGIQLGYITMEVKFSRGIASGRFSGDHAGLFLAAWNGAFAYDSLDIPDSAQYAVGVTRLNPDTVRLVGRETGETVTVTFVGFRKSRWYASDRAGRIPYSQEDYYRSCDIEDWYEEFLEENRRPDQVLKQGAPSFRRPSGRFPNAPFHP